MKVPARAICKLTTSTLGPRTMGGVFGTGNEPKSGPLVIRVYSFSSVRELGLIAGVPSATGGLTSTF